MFTVADLVSLRGHSKEDPNLFSRPIIAQCRSKVLQNASAILSTFIKLPFAIKTFVLSSFEWPLKSGFTVLMYKNLTM